MSDIGDWWKRKFQRMDEAASQRYARLKSEEEARHRREEEEREEARHREDEARRQAQHDDRFRSLEQQIQDLKKEPRGSEKSSIRKTIEAAAEPLIAAGEENPTAKLLEVWKNSPNQGKPKDDRERQTRRREIRKWTKPLRDKAVKKEGRTN